METKSNHSLKDPKLKGADESKLKSNESLKSVKSAENPLKSDDQMLDKDPLKDERRLKFLKRIISHLCLLMLILALNSVILGVCAHVFYVGKTHLVIFGVLSLMQLISAPVGFYAIKCGNRVLFLVCSIINFVWIISVVVLLLYYWIFNTTKEFKGEIALHVGAVIFLSASIVLAVCCFLMTKQLDMISVGYKQPKVVIATDKATK